MNKKLFSEGEYWFPAKRYGWGWGFPSAWQGWVTIFLYLALMIMSGKVFPPSKDPTSYFISVLLLSAALLFVCWYKGEPARWRWGGDDLC